MADQERFSFRAIGARGCAAVCLATAAFVAGCGDDDSSSDDSSSSGTSASTLKERLMPAEELDLEVGREFEWDNPTDFIVEGVFISEGTTPSEIIGEIDDAGFSAAAGQIAHDESGEVFAFVGAASFDSEEGAVSALDILHAEDLRQPCFDQCAVAPVEYEVEGIPDSAAVRHVPSKGELPPGLFPFEAFHVEFTVGSDLYIFQTSGPPGLSEEDFNEDATAFYEHVTADSQAGS